MKRKLSFWALVINLLLAFLFAVVVAPLLSISPIVLAIAIVAISTTVQYFVPNFFKNKAMEGLQTEVWIPDIKENPVPDHSFVLQSTDMSEHVDNNKLHLAEAGIEPGVHEDYFTANENPLPVATIEDIPNEVVLATYSTDQTRHRDLQDVELSYNKRQSVIGRHRISLEKNLGKKASFAWSPSVQNEFNKIMNLTASDSIIDAIIDLEAFYAGLDRYADLNICFNAAHLARIKKEDKKLYKEILSEKEMYGFKVFRYSQTPLYLADGTKKPFGAAKEEGDKQSSFTWVSNEVFRCFGDVKMYATLKDSGLQADVLSFAQRALVGNIRANNPKYLGAII